MPLAIVCALSYGIYSAADSTKKAQKNNIVNLNDTDDGNVAIKTEDVTDSADNNEDVVHEQAEAQFDLLVKQMAEQEGVTEHLKEKNQMLWVQRMNNILVLDEIGRGTPTYDGMAIARAVLEYCADPRRLGAKTMFATH